MKKLIILVALLLIVGGCSLTKKIEPTDFLGLYRAHIDASTDEVSDISERWGYAGNYEMQGSIRALADIPTLFSGSIRSDYDGIVHNYGLSQDSSINLIKPEMVYEMLIASGSLRADQLSMISKGGDVFLRYSGLTDTSIFEDAVRTVLRKYENSWLAITDEEILSTLSGASDEAAYKMSQAFLRMSLEDMRGYLRDYPLWKETKSLGIVDGLSTFEVELSRENIISLMDAFAMKSTGKKLDDISRSGLIADLDTMKVRGRVGYDTTDPLHARIDIIVGTGSDTTLSILQSRERWKLDMSGSGSKVALDIEKNGDDRILTGSIGAGEENIDIEAKLDYDGEKFVALDMKLSSTQEGLSVKLRHEKKEDGNFEGILDAGVGTLSWKGKISLLKGIEELRLKGAMIGSSLSLDLIPGTGGLLRGPLVVKNGDEKIIEANIGLRIDRERLDLALDIPSPESDTIRTRAEISVMGKREKTTKNIEIPQNTQLFSILSDEISRAMPLESDIGTPDIPSSFTGKLIR